MDINNGLLVSQCPLSTGPYWAEKSQRAKTYRWCQKIKKSRSENLPSFQDLPTESVASWGYVFQLNTQTVAVGSI